MAARLARHIGERRVIGGEPLQPGGQAAEHGLVETAADPPGVAQGAGFVVLPDEQRAQPQARAAGFGIAADDEFLARPALELDPAPAAAAAVGCPGPLADQAFQPELAGLFEHGRELLAGAGEMIAVADRPTGPAERRGQLLLAFE